MIKMRQLIGYFRKPKKLESFEAIATYWDNRYKNGGTSGFGSYGRPAIDKANYINKTIKIFEVASVVDLGCGDGNQLGLLELDNCSYTGVDIAGTSIQICIDRYSGPNLTFIHALDFESLDLPSSDLALSLDVLYHLTDDKTYFLYLDKLFSSAKRVLIYSMDFNDPNWNGHSRPRKFSEDISLRYPNYKLIDKTDNSDPEQVDMKFFLYEQLL